LEEDLSTWILQGNPDQFDVDSYLQQTDYIYWSVSIPKHRDEMRTGDSVFLWRSQGDKKAISGIIAFGVIEEVPVAKSQVRFPISLYDALWQTNYTEKSEFKVGVRVREYRLSPTAGMVLSSTIKADPNLSLMQIIRTRVGTSFLLNAGHASELMDNWNMSRPTGLDEVSYCSIEPSSDEEVVRKRTSRLLKRRVVNRPLGVSSPGMVQVSSSHFARDPLVRAWVLLNSKGICELCEDTAPFKKDDGEGYLEVHHLVPLAVGGSDTVENAAALCPNCHRELHYSALRLERTTELLGKIKR